MILAVDTTSEFGSVALRRGGKTVAESRIHALDGFGHLVLQAIQELLARTIRNSTRSIASREPAGLVRLPAFVWAWRRLKGWLRRCTNPHWHL